MTRRRWRKKTRKVKIEMAKEEEAERKRAEGRAQRAVTTKKSIGEGNNEVKNGREDAL